MFQTVLISQDHEPQINGKLVIAITDIPRKVIMLTDRAVSFKVTPDGRAFVYKKGYSDYVSEYHFNPLSKKISESIHLLNGDCLGTKDISLEKYEERTKKYAEKSVLLRAYLEKFKVYPELDMVFERID